MANTDNSCSGLEIENLYSEVIKDKSKSSLHELYSLQKDIQENVYGYDFKKLRQGPMSKMVHFFMWNTHAQIDEAHEAMDALGGIKEGIGSGVWKPWKVANKKIDSYSFNQLLTENDKKELKMELIDELHFLFNKMHAVGLTTEELYDYYFSKNKENRNRQKMGY